MALRANHRLSAPSSALAGAMALSILAACTTSGSDQPPNSPQLPLFDRAGNMFYFAAWSPELQLRKLNPDGTIAWIKNLPFHTDDHGAWVTFTASGELPQEVPWRRARGWDRRART